MHTKTVFLLPNEVNMIGTSKPLQEIKTALGRIAASNCTVLITGETGTGKELAAEYIHRNSSRRERRFVCINCAAIPDSLLENELFGHSRGAFTGADAMHEGLLMAADGGTVFLDEIGDMSLAAQAKILRVIETKEICRIGATRTTKLDIRFVAATNQDLEAMAAEGAFRKDLFFRLSVAHVHMPALRERMEDLPLLLKHYCREFNPTPGLRLIEFSEDSLRILLKYDWPGNIRELKNLAESLCIAAVPSPIEPEHLPGKLRAIAESCSAIAPDPERESLISALSWSGGNKAAAARRLNWSRMTLYRKLSKHRLLSGTLVDSKLARTTA
jgi:two-component system response regulator HydG/two-component system response regulator AtoC